MKRISTDWIKHVKEDKDKEELTALVYRSKPILDVLKNILEKKKKANRSTADDYDSPSWAYKQADHVGYTRALEEVIKLVTLDEEV